MEVENKIVFSRDAERSMSWDKPVLKSEVSRPYITKVYPSSGTATFLLTQGNLVEFELPRSGFLPSTLGAESHLEFSVTVPLTAATTVYLEPYAIFQRVYQLINSTDVNGSALRRDKMAALKVLDSCLQQTNTRGSAMGVSTSWAEPPFVSSVSASASAASFDVNEAAVTRKFTIPLSFFCDGLLSDVDSLVSLEYIRQIILQLQLNAPERCAWAHNATVPVTPPPITLSDMKLILPLVYLKSDAEVAKVRSAIDGEGLVYVTNIISTQEVNPNQPMSGGQAGNSNTIFGAVPASVRYVDLVIEGTAQRVSNNAAYKALTCLQAGLTDYVFKIDGELVPRQPVLASASHTTGADTPIDVEAYRHYLDCSEARKRSMRDYKNWSGQLASLKSFSASRYACSDPQATGVAATVVPMFRACADLSSVSRDLFSGSKFHRLEFQYSFDGTVGKWDAAPNGTQASNISEVSFILQCYCNRALQVTRGSMTVLM
jgi:hypothetical protein